MNSEFSNKVKAEALRLGFYACGIARAEPVDDDTAAAFRQWLKDNRHGDMHYMESHADKRLNPTLLMPGAKSIVSVALGYAPAMRIPPGQYQIAAYAYGRDYHDIMKAKLRQLAAFIQQEAGPSLLFRIFTDTAPILERYWARQAGIGWTGRNHQLIIPHAGSMFFLGEILLNIEMACDQPMADHCGNCRQCIDHCPTHALTENAFDARRCISYHTIESRNDIPEEIAARMGDSIYGCDRCTAACPWNRFATPTQEPLLQPSRELLSMTREQWKQMTEDDYRRLFKGSAVKRAKYSGLKRNIQAVGEHEEVKSEK
ncbi:MAG: tRNA epoxyqueuosine(34) reductase QueG [Prevotella sp.]|nr:tRNA epoxyqueuosine(34) reductase QueG [Prevotella sp.]